MTACLLEDCAWSMLKFQAQDSAIEKLSEAPGAYGFLNHGHTTGVNACE